MTADGLRDVAEAAKYLKIGKSTLQRLATAHAVPCTRIGRLVRFTQEDLDEIVRRGHQPVMRAPGRAQVVAIRQAAAGDGRPQKTNPPPQKTNPPPGGPKTNPPPGGPKKSDGKNASAA